MNTSLLAYNTMQVDIACKGIASITSPSDVTDFIATQNPYRILGGGSNVLLTQDVDAYILHNQIKGIEILSESKNDLLVRVGGGEIWHAFVTWSVYHGFGGVENLALIPGTVGAAPIQNIGAYGVEQSDTCVEIGVVDMVSGIYNKISADKCLFGYRDSIFKRSALGQYFITDVTYCLSKYPKLKISYGGIEERLPKSIEDCGSRDVYDAVVKIRQEKLPDPRVLGNTGSFFKNPVVSEAVKNRLRNRYGDAMPSYAVTGGYKIPAAWLIQEAGLKGYRLGDAGIYERHALILVNHGSASGTELLDVAKHVQDCVFKVFGIELHPEVNIW